MRFGIDENERDRMWRMRTIRVEGEMRGDERGGGGGDSGEKMG